MAQLQVPEADPGYQIPTLGPHYRPPLGLPPGSVRAALALMIGGLFWVLLLLSDKAEHIPLYLYFLLGLEMLFVIAHGHTIGPEGTGQPPPWWLPRGFFRGLIALGFLLTLGWRLYQDPEQLWQQLTPSAEQLTHWPYLLVAASVGFGLGRLLGLGPWERSPWFRDIQAWVSILALMALGAEILIVAFINPTLKQVLDLTVWEYLLTGVVFCYFAVRC